jgi:sulfatase modifying factor 1
VKKYVLQRKDRQTSLVAGAIILALLVLGGWAGLSVRNKLIEKEAAVAATTRLVQENANAEAVRIAQARAATAEAARIAKEKAETETARIAQERATAEAARIAQERADAEEKQRQMASQLERERVIREEEMKKQADANDFNTGKVGDTRVVDLGGGVKLTLCYCPPGSFTMGSPVTEANRRDDEDQVPVKISRGFWLAKTECTQAQWHAVMGTEPSRFKGDDLPVEQVSWEDTQAFMATLNGKNLLPAGWQWSLPTEAQWEYACRAGTKTAFSFGDTLSSKQANFDGSLPLGSEIKGPFLEKTSPVGSYAANAWGLQDMHGNVWEVCEDASHGGRKLPGGTAPVGSGGSDRVDRGGSWGSMGEQNCRSASRGRGGSDHRSDRHGFRAASVPVER